jgi:hypothetical protein
MRNGLLIIFFLCLYFHFQGRTKTHVEEDAITLTQSAVRPLATTAKALPSVQNLESINESTESKFIETASLDIAAVSDEEFSEDEVYEEDVTQLPWEDIEAGWKTHLKEFLVGLDPDKAEEMFTAYLEEKKKYLEKVEFSDKSLSDPQTGADGESELSEFDRLHVENLREIFGEHYSQVESIHKDYVDSVQYLNRSQVKFSISL